MPISEAMPVAERGAPQIIGLGGGGFSIQPDDLVLERYVLRQSGRSKPRVCFVPTASGDDEGYIRRFYAAFAALDCVPSHLSLFHLPTKDIEGFILDKDVIYVGGGNTRSLLALWREWRLDAYLRKAWENGVVLAGVSAGAMCWFEGGVSDYFPDELNNLDGLGFLPGSCCPHYDGDARRRDAYQEFISRGELNAGFAIDDFAAIHFVGRDLFRAVSSRQGAGVYQVVRDGLSAKESVVTTLSLEASGLVKGQS